MIIAFCSFDTLHGGFDILSWSHGGFNTANDTFQSSMWQCFSADLHLTAFHFMMTKFN
jgi:hypothetical protein